MRPTFWSYFETFRSRLQPSGLPRPDIETMFTVELFVVGCLLIDSTMDVMEGWTILAGYDTPILPAHANYEVAHRLRVLYSSMRSRASWEQYFERYENVNAEYRMFELQAGRWTVLQFQ
jgi:hypothetical protein